MISRYGRQTVNKLLIYLEEIAIKLLKKQYICELNNINLWHRSLKYIKRYKLCVDVYFIRWLICVSLNLYDTPKIDKEDTPLRNKVDYTDSRR